MFEYDQIDPSIIKPSDTHLVIRELELTCPCQTRPPWISKSPNPISQNPTSPNERHVRVWVCYTGQVLGSDPHNLMERKHTYPHCTHRAQGMVHLWCEQRKCHSERRTHCWVAHHYGRCDRPVCDDKVGERGWVDEVDSGAERYGCDDWHDPVDVFVRGEGYAEKADGDQDAAHLAHHECYVLGRIGR